MSTRVDVCVRISERGGEGVLIGQRRVEALGSWCRKQCTLLCCCLQMFFKRRRHHSSGVQLILSKRSFDKEERKETKLNRGAPKSLFTLASTRFPSLSLHHSAHRLHHEKSTDCRTATVLIGLPLFCRCTVCLCIAVQCCPCHSVVCRHACLFVFFLAFSQSLVYVHLLRVYGCTCTHVYMCPRMHCLPMQSRSLLGEEARACICMSVYVRILPRQTTDTQRQ